MNDDDATRSVERTLKILETARVPEGLQPVAFSLVWQSLASGGLSAKPDDSDAVGVHNSRFGPLAGRLGIDPDSLADLFQPGEDGTFSIHVPSTALASTKSEATRELALLAFASRQCSAEEWTSAEVVREVCQLFDKFDSANFASYMAKGESNWMVSGKGQARRYKLRNTGWEEAARLVRRLTGSE